jgi:hypothetical protein
MANTAHAQNARHQTITRTYQSLVRPGSVKKLAGPANVLKLRPAQRHRTGPGNVRKPAL